MQNVDHFEKVHFEENEKLDITDYIRFRKDDMGRLLLRLSIGGLMLVHGINKMIYGTEEVNRILTSVGIPSFFSFGVFLGEVLAPIMLIIGFKVRIGAFLIALNMIIAILLVHSSQFYDINQLGGWMLELNALYLLGAIALIFLGSGRIAITKGRGVLD